MKMELQFPVPCAVCGLNKETENGRKLSKAELLLEGEFGMPQNRWTSSSKEAFCQSNSKNILSHRLSAGKPRDCRQHLLYLLWRGGCAVTQPGSTPRHPYSTFWCHLTL